MVREFGAKVSGMEPSEIVRETASAFGAGNVGLASSLGAEDQVLTHLIRTHAPDIGIFTIDTGRLPQETYDAMQATMEKYGFRYDLLFPDAEQVVKLVGEHGPNLFYVSVDMRKKCCGTRKVVPLQKKLKTLEAWICGLRREQSVTRNDAAVAEWDEANGLVKISPIIDWTHDQVWEYIRKNKVPYNKLHDKGYASIGCAPCTRAIAPGEDIRAGRWWWEDSQHKECGLHRRKNKA
jgi:phosphoadenosine phosphosulfate reductase